MPTPELPIPKPGERKRSFFLNTAMDSAFFEDMNRAPRKILILAETVTAAHAIRCLDLTRSMNVSDDRSDEPSTEIHFAARDLSEKLRALFSHLRFHALKTSLTPAEFGTALRAGSIGIDGARLEAQIAEDLALIRAIRPDEVIGDFRLSLAISARLAGVHYVNLVNAFWHPEAPLPTIPPNIPPVRALGRRICDPIFRLFAPVFLNAPLRTLNPVLLRHGIPRAASLQELYCRGDKLLHPDPRAFFPEIRDARSRFIGPLTWTPPQTLPSWWSEIRRDLTTVYFSMGSSGYQKHSERFVHELASAGYQVLWAAGADFPNEQVRDRVFRAPYLPLPEVAGIAKAAVLNGGSAQGYFFLEKNIPFVGVPDNLDQILFMNMLARAKRADLCTLRTAMIPSDQVARRGLLLTTVQGLLAP